MSQLIILKDNERNMRKANSVKDRQSFKKVMVRVLKNEGWKIEIKWKKGGEMGKGADR